MIKMYDVQDQETGYVYPELFGIVQSVTVVNGAQQAALNLNLYATENIEAKPVMQVQAAMPTDDQSLVQAADTYMRSMLKQAQDTVKEAVDNAKGDNEE